MNKDQRIYKKRMKRAVFNIRKLVRRGRIEEAYRYHAKLSALLLENENATLVYMDRGDGGCDIGLLVRRKA